MKKLPDISAVSQLALYVHIPFCFHKCHYCDFYSITRQTPQRMEHFVDRILREADLWADAHRDSKICPTTIFFGGGTPTLLPMPFMRQLIVGLQHRFDFSKSNEWTIEANPATVNLEYCQILRELGVDRLSFGAQSFQKPELAILERHHEPDDVPRSLEFARSAGFKRLNIDLIYAIPGQDLPSWERSLESAIALGTEHLSCYGLTYEPNTPMAVRLRLGQFRATESPLEITMMHHTRSRLAQAGLPPYEISNYSRPGRECRHNLNYWTGGNYIGLGPSAASHVDGQRWRNRPHLGEWESAIDAGNLPAIEYESLSQNHRAGELAMLMLRLSGGINIPEFVAKVALDPLELFARPIEQLSREKLIEADSHSIRITEKGLTVADSIASEFLAVAANLVTSNELQ
jgi:oxygen-independent coproporphyrinogen-3 oxidase